MPSFISTAENNLEKIFLKKEKFLKKHRICYALVTAYLV